MRTKFNASVANNVKVSLSAYVVNFSAGAVCISQKIHNIAKSVMSANNSARKMQSGSFDGGMSVAYSGVSVVKRSEICVTQDGFFHGRTPFD